MENKEIQKESESKKDSENEKITLIDTEFINSQFSDPMENVVDYD